MITRPLSLDDIPALLQIEQGCHFEPWGQASFEQSLIAPQYQHWGAFSQESSVFTLRGYAIFMVIPPEIELLNITVDPAYQNHGIAQKLLDTAFLFFHENQIERCFLEVRQSNLIAQKLYLKNNFHLIGTRPRYYPTITGKEDALLMEKPFPFLK